MTVVLGQESDTIAMEPLYEGLLQQKFMSSTEAIEYCRQSCQEYGFTIKQETGANKNIYIYCSREGVAGQAAAQRKRPLKNCDCQWRVVLSQDEYAQWTFRKSLKPSACEHNHTMQWPSEMVDKIIQLARQQKTTDDEIRSGIKLQFPNVSWDDRLFYNYLNAERKRMKQKGITERVQKLVMASTRLCSVVAANEDWASSVESDLTRMLEMYREMTKVTNSSLDSMVDLQLDMIHSEIDNKRNKRGELKKRKITALQGVQVMSIPSCTLFIRSQPLRSLSETRQSFDSPPPQLLNPFNLGSPSSSPSSTSSIQQRIDYAYTRNNEMLQSPPIPDNHASMIMTPSSFNNNNNYLAPYTPDFHYHHHANYYPRESSPNTSHLQQRIILQEYEQQRHIQQSTTLPIIRSTMQQHQQQQQQQQQQHWS